MGRFGPQVIVCPPLHKARLWFCQSMGPVMTCPGGEGSPGSSAFLPWATLLLSTPLSLMWTGMHGPPATPWLSSHSPPRARRPFYTHRIDGNTALHRDIYPSVSLQIQKNFAKSKWRVSGPSGEVGGLFWALELSWGRAGMGASRGFPVDAGPPWTVSEMRRGRTGFRRPRGGGKAGAPWPSENGEAQRRLWCPLSKPSTRPRWSTT